MEYMRLVGFSYIFYSRLAVSLDLVQLTLADACPNLFPLQDGDQRQAGQVPSFLQPTSVDAYPNEDQRQAGSVSGFLQLTLVDAYPDLFSDQ